ncbi:Trypsin-like peptidase domain-containing protein [Cupriavidus sp. YR651]|uniref:S1 family peptidase n=1 Tax=Cupriavidus sp. YR651 TaxID=1855315 RepID=UPI00088C4EBE|nr:serine protease [Cupriavidus sp. YR651]SDD02788.1 Trypsin-like peptidase domain-containing protein [Cupriavidus sp. YR651]
MKPFKTSEMQARRLPIHRAIALGAMSCLWMGLAASPAAALESAPLIAKVSPSVYAIRTYGAQETPMQSGSAVVIGPGQLVTTCHLLAGARSIAVRRDNISYGATLAAPDVERDLCLLNVANFTAPAAAVSPSAAPAFGQRVYAASVVDGSIVSVREGTVTGLQAASTGKLERIQASMPDAPGSSGGALFDDSGRLIGILSRPTAGDTLTRALPATWISEIKARGSVAMATYQPSQAPAAPAAQAVAAGVATQAAQAGGTESPRVGEVWQYELIDNHTKTRRPVTYRVDRLDGDRVIFNQGARVETRDGRVSSITTPIGGEFDIASPTGGWVPDDVKIGMRWKAAYRQPGNGFRTELEGTAASEASLSVDGKDLRTIRINYVGWVSRPFYGAGSNSSTNSRYKASAWYAPELRRVVRFEATYSSWERVNETLQLVSHRFE